MAIHLYAAQIKTNEQGKEYVENFHPFVIAKATNLSYSDYRDGVCYTRATVQINTNNVEGATNEVDEIPTNLVELFRTCYDYPVTTTDLNPLKHKKINFFSEQDLDTKLNFEMELIGTSNYGNDGIFVFGDIKRGILLKNGIRFNYSQTWETFSYCCLVINPAYDGDTIEDLLSSSRKQEEIYFKNGFYNNLFNAPEFAPFYMYTQDYPNQYTDFYSVRDGGIYKGNLETMNNYMVNLSRWGNWNTLLKGSYWYGTPFKLELENEIKGLKTIELGVTLTPYGYDEGVNFISTYGQDENLKQFDSVGFSYYTAGTDLLYLFDVDNDNPQIIYLKNGYIRRYKKTGESGFHIQLVNSSEGLDCFVGDNDAMYTTKSFDNRGVLSGLYLYVPNNYAKISVNYWIKDIPLDFNKWEYKNCPLMFASYAAQKIKTSYINYEDIIETTPLPGVVVNFGYINSYNPNNYITDELTISYDFWNRFLSGLFEELPGVNLGGGSLGGGTSGGGGGNGGFNDSSFGVDNFGDIVNTNPLSAANTKFLHIYNFNASALADFAIKCWDTNFDISDITKFFGNNTNPMDSLISVRYSPINVTGQLTNTVNICGQQILLGDTTVERINKDVQYISFGSIDVDEYFGSFVDYQETKISLVLPYVGIQTLNTNEIMGGSLTLSAAIDILDGSITYYLLLNKNNVSNITNTWRGACMFDIATSNYDMRGKVNTLISSSAGLIGNTASGAVSGSLIGGGVGATIGAGVGLLSSVVGIGASYLSSTPSINRGGNFAGNRFSIVKPYLIIERPKQSIPENYASMYGYPCNQKSILKYNTGYTVVEQVHLENMGVATSEEINEIETLLKQGVIF